MATSMKMQISIDKKKNRVIFAEAKKNFVDFIFHIMTLPLGAVQRIIAKNTPSASLGSIGTLEEGIKNLDYIYMQSPANYYILNLVKAPYWGKNTTLLLPEASRFEPRKFYQCSKDQTVRVNTLCSHIFPSDCSPEVKLAGFDGDIAEARGNENGYVKELVMFMVMDDLVVRPAEPSSVFSMINEHSTNKDVGNIEKREAIKLLKASISSKTVLTDVFLSGAAV